MITRKELEQMVNGYIECMMWSSPIDSSDGDDATFRDFDYDIEDFEATALHDTIMDCFEFACNTHHMWTLKDGTRASAAQIGHDFWLTRNHHGAGFWDGDYQFHHGEAMTAAAQRFKELNPFLLDHSVHLEG